MRFSVYIALPAILLISPSLQAEGHSPPAKGAADPQSQFFESKGLRKQGSAFVLAGEGELGKLAREVGPLQRSVFDAAKALTQAEQLETDRLDEIDRCTRQETELAAQMPKVTNQTVRNNMVLQSNALVLRLKQLHDSKDLDKKLTSAREQLGSAREAFVDQVLKMRSLADQLEHDYQALAADEEVTKALTAAAPAGGKNMTLGPTATYKRSVATLKKLEASLLSKSIKMRRDRNTFFVDVVVGNKSPHEFVVDTGASMVTLSSRLAADLGLTPSNSSPKVRCSLADGREVDAHLVLAKSLRVGPFAVDNVECVVLMADAPPLLGMSYLSHYNCRINTESGTMTLTKVEGPGATNSKAGTKSKKTAGP